MQLQTQPRPTILIVDDQAVNLIILEDLFQDRCNIVLASSGAKALDILKQRSDIDLVLLDMVMPEMDGYQVLEALNANPTGKHIRVICVTSQDTESDEEHCFDLGALDFIAKPIRPRIVEARVRNHIALKQATDSLEIQNADLDAEVHRRMQENLTIQYVAMRTLASLAETRDNETGNHILRTQAYVEVLVLHLRNDSSFSELRDDEYLNSIVRAAPLHDIGKVGIPDSVLKKSDALTKEEFLIMQTHTTLGAQAIEKALQIEEKLNLPFFKVAIDIAKFHHEKWNGTGYPYGLKGRQIPLVAQVMAIADVFDALISKRCYKSAYSVDDSFQIIRDGSGVHFNPKIVEAFEEKQDSIRQIVGKYRESQREVHGLLQ